MLFRLTEKDGLWKKIRNHVGTKVEHPVSPATRAIRSRISDEGVEKTVSVCPYCAVGCSTLGYLRAARLALPLDEGPLPQTLLGRVGGPLARGGARHDRREGQEDQGGDLGREGCGRQEAEPLHGPGLHRRRHDRQRGELPHNQAFPFFGVRTNYQPGANMTQLYGARSGHYVR